MSLSKTLAAVRRTKQYKTLINSGLSLVSSDRQLSNGTLTFSGKIQVGKKTFSPVYSITTNGVVISNKFVARRVGAQQNVTDDSTCKTTDVYRQGLNAISEILSKRISILSRNSSV